MASDNKRMSLTTFLDYSRTGWAFAGAALVGLMIFEIIYSAIVRWRNSGLAEDYSIPNYLFGQLPGIRFPYQAASARPQSYERRFSDWPRFGEPSLEGLTMGNVYQLESMSYSLSADQAARQIATNLEFYSEPRIIDQRTYLYTYSGAALQESLTIDLKTMFVNLDTNYLNTTNIFGTIGSRGERQIPDRVDAIAAAKDYLAVAGILPGDLSDQASSVEYMTSVGESLQPVNSALEADYALVSLSRQPIDCLKDRQPTDCNFYGPDGYSSIQAVVGRDTTGHDVVVQLDDYYYGMNLDNVGTYIFRSTQQAWASLEAGDAYVLNPRGVRNAVIRSVELGYYESHGEQTFLLPIYVFKGDNGVVAYVQALDYRMYY